MASQPKHPPKQHTHSSSSRHLSTFICTKQQPYVVPLPIPVAASHPHALIRPAHCPHPSPQVLRLDQNGAVRRLRIKRRDLLRNYRLQPRDLRRIDPTIDFTKTSPSITIKEDVLLLNLGGIRSAQHITAQGCWLQTTGMNDSTRQYTVPSQMSIAGLVCGA